MDVDVTPSLVSVQAKPYCASLMDLSSLNGSFNTRCHHPAYVGQDHSHRPVDNKDTEETHSFSAVEPPGYIQNLHQCLEKTLMLEPPASASTNPDAQ